MDLTIILSCGVLALLMVGVVAAPAEAQPQSEPRPLDVRGADSRIVRAELHGPILHTSDLFMAFEDYHHPRIHQLREQYDFLEAIADEPSDFRRQLLLRNWIHRQWPIDDAQNFGGDAFAILEHARATGEGFHCAHCMTVQQAVMAASGYIVRNLGVDRDHTKYGRSYHHGVNEVWSNEHAKWVMFDAKHDNHFERDGVPLSALEIQEAIRAGEKDKVQIVIGPDRTAIPHPQDLAFSGIETYWWISFHQRQNGFTQPHFGDRGALVVYDNEAFRDGIWHRGSGASLAPSWAYAANAFIRVSERSQIEWTPNVTALNVRQVEPGRLRVHTRSATPNFGEYRYRVNEGPWRSAGGGEAIDWPLAAGVNRLEVRARNLFDVDGPPAVAVVEYQP